MVNRHERRAGSKVAGPDYGSIKDGEAVPEGTAVISSPRFDVSGIQLVNAGNEFLLAFTHASFGHVVGAPDGVAGIQGVPVVQLSMSPQTLKDLMAVLIENLGQYEKEWGVVETPYTRKTAGK